ncbi:DNA repair endonuclease XPF [Carpediemonas membranifera]|uniref:DNA repair endonuclease XPF n=1 Tax=Carpediemonas membranifera TaxID=201153 RepID=A0A8J6E742_9EUKA|nr:DNA repair endonuclease XPF [Carpediemonas membranifera]|eukprot:KAG9390265.1 DNA repair endonuclease XPF [Carpediemonas membranifera]
MSFHLSICASLVDEPGLLVMGKGMGINHLVALFLSRFCRAPPRDEDVHPVILVINEHSRYCSHEALCASLAAIGVDPSAHPVKLNVDTPSAARAKMYQRGGVVFTTVRIAALDVAAGTLLHGAIRGVVVLHAHSLLSQYSIGAKAATHFIKYARNASLTHKPWLVAFTDQVARLDSATTVRRLMTSLSVGRANLWPRHRKEVEESVSRHPVTLVTTPNNTCEEMRRVLSCASDAIRAELAAAATVPGSVVPSPPQGDLAPDAIRGLVRTSRGMPRAMTEKLEDIAGLIADLHDDPGAIAQAVFVRARESRTRPGRHSWIGSDLGNQILMTAQSVLTNSPVIAPTIRAVSVQLSKAAHMIRTPGAGPVCVILPAPLMTTIATLACLVIEQQLPPDVAALAVSALSIVEAGVAGGQDVGGKVKDALTGVDLSKVRTTMIPSDDSTFPLVQSDSGRVTVTTNPGPYLLNWLIGARPSVFVVIEPTLYVTRTIETFRAMTPGHPVVMFAHHEAAATEESRAESIAFERLAGQKLAMQAQPMSTEQQLSGVAVAVDTREFGSEIPLMLLSSGATVVPLTLPIADYVPGKDVGIERKAFADLLGSLDSRLYHQAAELVTRFPVPLLMVDVAGANIGDLYAGRPVGLIATLLLHVPGIRFSWTNGPESFVDRVHRRVTSSSVKEVQDKVATLSQVASQDSEPAQLKLLRALVGGRLGPRTVRADPVLHLLNRLRTRFGCLAEVFTASVDELIGCVGPEKALVLQAIGSSRYDPEKKRKAPPAGDPEVRCTNGHNAVTAQRLLSFLS